MSDLLADIQIRKRNIEINILTRLQNYKRTLIASSGIGIDILQELSVHREKLDEVDGHLQMIKEDLDESDDHINSISSFIGALKSFFFHHEEKGKRKVEEITGKLPRKRNGVEDVIPHPTLKIRKEPPADPNDFQSVVNREMQEINYILNELHRAAVDMDIELDAQNDLLDGQKIKFEKNEIHVRKEINACNKLLNE